MDEPWINTGLYSHTDCSINSWSCSEGAQLQPTHFKGAYFKVRVNGLSLWSVALSTP